ncbi:MAG: hypothetical protein IPP32_12870 [Bacteroidetes bacterium]|nr:hypothetical protein [Bacteroidota bacterium]
MKNLIFSIAIILAATFALNAQTSVVPNSINLQAIARDGSGNIVSGNGTTNNIQVRLTFIDSISSIDTLIKLIYNRPTDAFGQFNIEVSQQTITSQVNGSLTNMNQIDWSKGKKKIKIEYNSCIACTWNDLGVIDAASTFYAFHSRTAEKLTTTGNNGDVLKRVSGQWVASNDNDNQTLSQSGNTVTLSNSGGSVNVDPIQDYAILIDSVANGVSGGTNTPGSWQTRRLNEISSVSGTSISLLPNNQIQLAVGKYYIEASAPAHQVGGHACRFSKVSGTATPPILWGSTEYSYSGGGTSRSIIKGVISVNTSSIFIIEHFTEVQANANALGVNSTAGMVGPSIFTQVRIQKIQ